MKFVVILLVLSTVSPVWKVKVKYDDLALKKCRSDFDFTSHGWWPEYRKGSWPQFCDPSRYSEFTESAIAPIRNQLDEYWYACPEWGTNSYQLWKHEWEKHGTCIPDISVLDYFNHTLSAFKKAKRNNWFGCCGCCGCRGKGNQCLIPFAKPINETKWLGYCYK